MLKDFMSIIVRCLIIISILAGVLMTIAGTLELLSGSGAGMLIGGIVCIAAPSVLMLLFEKFVGNKIADKEHKKTSKCEKCDRNIGGGKYEYVCDFRKLRKVGTDDIEVDVFITAYCPYCGHKNSIYEPVLLDKSNASNWNNYVENYVGKLMHNLRR